MHPVGKAKSLSSFFLFFLMLYSRTPLVIYLTLTKHLSWSSADEPPFGTGCEISQARRCQGCTITCSSLYAEDLNTAHWNSAYKDSDLCHQTLCVFFSGVGGGCITYTRLTAGRLFPGFFVVAVCTVAQFLLLQSFHSVFNYMFLLYNEKQSQRFHDFISFKCFYWQIHKSGALA